ncbi:MAG: DUF885 domain-containing protein [Theionarchaea archaeon]|nr:DUF885 domain-containing protein [Theionarchaea archaeon]
MRILIHFNSRKSFFRKISYRIAVCILVFAMGCIGQSPESLEQPESPVSIIVSHLQGVPIDEFFDESYKQLLLRYPERLTELGISDWFGLRNDQLNNLSDEYIRETQEVEKAILDLLHEYDRSTLTPEQQISYDVYEWYLDDRVRGHEFMYYNYTVHHFLLSYHDELIRLFTEYHTITTKEDAEDYVSRLSKVDTQIDQVIEGMKLREEKGVVPPKFILEMTEYILVDFLDSSSHDPTTISGRSNLLYGYFRENLNKVDITEEEKQYLLDSALKEMEESVIPAYVKLLEFVQYQETIATNDAGVWKFPNGEEYYRYVLRHETSTDLTPEEIHQMGLAEVERIKKEMNTVFEELGYPLDGNLDDLVNRAIKEGGYIDAYSKSGKDLVITTYEEILDEVSQELEKVFDIFPEAELVVIGELSFGGGGGYYVGASLDGSRPGAFHTGIGSTLVPRYRMPTIAYHEAIPGHYFQISIAQEMDLPLFQNDVIINGYAEGWALYAELLTFELGLYEDDPYGNIGRLHMELLRAVRLVADTGIHAKKWTREEAKAYMRDVLGSDSMIGEVDRYIVLPGQATGYMVGMIKILELRQKVINELGDQFDIKEFHHVILGGGGMPLTLLEQRVQDYIDARSESHYFDVDAMPKTATYKETTSNPLGTFLVFVLVILGIAIRIT